LSLVDRAIVRVLPAVPKSVVQLLSARYIEEPAMAGTIARAAVARIGGRG